ncbi:MAG: hypothetical protein IJU23_14115 [Proteobacteria bacterium]|nr:hypothetical protein [Pseudomonadota bacterium]
MRFLPFIALIFLAAGAVSACEAHDYWFVDDTIEVDASQDILTASTQEPLAQELFVRYQVDYEIENLSSEPTEAVVSATSYVNRTERATAQKVWHLDPDTIGQGILTASQLQLGNSISVSLQCCQASQCYPKETLCPQSDDLFDTDDDLATYCYDACKDVQPCIQKCPSAVACYKKCGEEQDMSSCIKANCLYGGSVASCEYICNGDEACLDSCMIRSECQDTCYSLAAACFRNCLSTWFRCTLYTLAYKSPSTKVPCALCRDSDDNPGTGLCDADLTPEIQEYYTLSNGSSSFVCTPDCSQFPPECMTECNELYESDKERMECLEVCISQHLTWCNSGLLSYDYIDASAKQPCCYETSCHNSLTAVVKTLDVSCFNDTDCKSGNTCSPEGVCVSGGSGGCSATSGTASFRLFWLILPATVLLRRKRRMNA